MIYQWNICNWLMARSDTLPWKTGTEMTGKSCTNESFSIVMSSFHRVCPGAQTISTDLCKDSFFWNLEFSPSKNQPNLITLATEVSETSTLIWSEKWFIHGGFLKWRYLYPFYPESPWVSIRKSSNDLDDLG